MKRLFRYISLIIMSFMMLITNSCAEDEFALSTERAIEFSSSYVGKPASRMAGDIDNGNVRSNSFYVYGGSYDSDVTNPTLLFDETIVSYNGNSWSYSPIKYYDSEKKYTFTGVMPAKTESDSYGIRNTQTSYTDGKITILNVPLTQEITNLQGERVGIDYLVSDAVDNHAAGDGTVLLNFKHILSRFSVYVYTGVDESTTVTLNQMSIYLPEGYANYEETNHSGPKSRVVNATEEVQSGDKWTWQDFENKAETTDANVGNKYKEHQLLKTPIEVKHYDEIPETENATLMPVEFFMAPIQYNKLAKKEDLQLYMKLKFTVDYKEDGIKQEIVRETPIKINDLHSFTQNYRTNLFVKLLAENDIIAFNVNVSDFENNTNHWVDQYGYSFDLMSYGQTFDGETPMAKIHGILDNYGNTLEGDSETELTYRLVNLKKDNKEFLKRDIPLDFSAGWDYDINGTYQGQHIKKNRYGKFTIDLTGLDIEDGWYTMFIKNSMNDVREYKIYLKHFDNLPEYYMAFTVRVGDNDKYVIPFVTYEAGSALWESTIGYSGSSWNYVWSVSMEGYWENAMGKNPEDFMKTCFSYPSNLWIDWGDNSSIQKINEGTLVLNENIPQHLYTNSNDYTITIYSDKPYGESEIPQINWSYQHIQLNDILKPNTGGIGTTDNKLVRIDKSLLTIDENWWNTQLTFNPTAICAPYGLSIPLSAFITRNLNSKVGSWLNGQSYYASPITMMFNTVGSQFTSVCENLFENNTEFYAADFTFQFCHGLTHIPSTIFKDCSNLIEMMNTFDNCAIAQVPEGLFDYLTGDVWFKCTFMDCHQLTNDKVADNLFVHCGSGTKLEGVFADTSVTKYNI